MPVIDIQRRGQQIGRLRLGVMVKPENGKARPEKLATWRFTTASKVAADAIAELYGGEIRDWQGQFEVITKESSIGVTIPPRDQVVSQYYEMWNKGGAVRRCTGLTEILSGKPCMCPHASNMRDEDEVARKALERANLAKQNPPQACSLITRISVMLPDLPGLGVFRLDTKSFYAAVEIGDTAQLLEMARAQGVFLPAMLRIDQRARVAGGKTTRYPVPVLEVLATFRQLASGALEAGGIKAQLPPAPGEQPKAITAAPSPDVPRPSQSAPGLAQETTHDAVAGPGHPQPPDDEARYALAQSIADQARAATTGAQLRECAAAMAQEHLEEEFVCETDDRESGAWVQLAEFLRELWREKAREGGR